MPHDPHIPDDAPQADDPGALGDRLRTVYTPAQGRSPDALAALDAAVLAHARARLGPADRRRTRAVAWRTAAGVGIAAVLTLGVWVAWPTPPRAPTAPEASLARVSGPGFDVVDVYAVALALRDHRPVDPRWDRTRDGRVSQPDIDALMGEIVRLEEM